MPEGPSRKILVRYHYPTGGQFRGIKFLKPLLKSNSTWKTQIQNHLTENLRLENKNFKESIYALAMMLNFQKFMHKVSGFTVTPPHPNTTQPNTLSLSLDRAHTHTHVHTERTSLF